MDFTLSETEEQVVASATSMLARFAGPDRARAVLYQGDGYDDQLARAIGDAGFADALRDEAVGPTAVALVVEAVAEHAGCAPVVGPLLVGPAVLGRSDLHSLVLVDLSRRGPVRFPVPGPALVVDGGHARVVELDASNFERVPTAYGYPMARVLVPDGGDAVEGSDAATRARAWWRLGLALEAVGSMRAALAHAVEYVKEREQFGQPIGMFQSIQHRLANAATLVEGARWLAYEAAWLGAPTGAAAAAAAFAATAAARVLRDAHQVHGAVGFTVEVDLHLWTMRLQAVRLELGGVDEHRRIAGATWLAAHAS